MMIMMMMRRTLEGRDTCHSLLELLYRFIASCAHIYIVDCLGRHETYVLIFSGIARILGLDNLYLCSNG